MSQDEPVIVTEGTGWDEQVADRAELQLTFDGQGRTRSAAVQELGKRVARAETAFALPSVTVAQRRLWVHTEWQRSKPAGCRATESIALRVRDVAVLEELLGAIVAAEPAALTGPEWSLSDPAAARARAQRRAVDDARHRAEDYASALGGRLGALRSLTDAADRAAPMVAMRAGLAEGTPDVRNLGLEPEPVRVTARCTTSWLFLLDAGVSAPTVG